MSYHQKRHFWSELQETIQGSEAGTHEALREKCSPSNLPHLHQLARYKEGKKKKKATCCSMLGFCHFSILPWD